MILCVGSNEWATDLHTVGHADSVDPTAFRPPFRFTGEIDRLVLDAGAEPTRDDEAELRQLMAHQ